jgi:hypothetical protein
MMRALLLASVVAVAAAHGGHDCIHDKITSSANFHNAMDNVAPQRYASSGGGSRRLLATFNKMRVHLDFSFLDSDPLYMCTDSTPSVKLTSNGQTVNCGSEDVLSLAKKNYLIHTVRFRGPCRGDCGGGGGACRGAGKGRGYVRKGVDGGCRAWGDLRTGVGESVRCVFGK